MLSKEILSIIISVIFLSVTLPAMVFIVQRYNVGDSQFDQRISHSHKLYETPELARAASIPLAWSQYIEIITTLKRHVKDSNNILALKPQFVTYLSGLYAEKLPPYIDIGDRDDFLRSIKASNADYILITDINFPTNPTGTDILPMLDGISDVVVSYKYTNLNRTAFALLKISRQ